MTIQAQILELFDDLVVRSNLGAILITHNLGIVAGHCDRVVVMYAGRVMESADVMDLFDHPAHPYTLGLLRCVPRLALTRHEDVPLHSRPTAPRHAARRWVPVCPTVRAGQRSLPYRDAANNGDRAGPHHRLLAPVLREGGRGLMAPERQTACWHDWDWPRLGLARLGRARPTVPSRCCKLTTLSFITTSAGPGP